MLACVVLNNMLRSQRGVGGRADRDLEDVVVPCNFENGQGDDAHDRHHNNSAKEQSSGPHSKAPSSWSTSWSALGPVFSSASQTTLGSF